jgi:cellulose synthase/poly-beta-1,6-N-acetylglucosamine synthase-like glycosyltransferase
MTGLAWTLIALPLVLFGYAYAGYPLLLRLATRGRGRGLPAADPAEWPIVTIVIPAYNEARSIGRTLDSVLSLPYPADRRQILVVSDASDDGTDEVVTGYAGRGVELLRMPVRGGKTAAELAAARQARGDVIVNIDATIRIEPDALMRLVRVFQDPGIGVASGRDVSVGDADREGNRGESGYVGYEMTVRSLETALDGIVGASGCFFAIRRELAGTALPGHLSRDFASPLVARENGFRSVSVHEAVCYVPRTRSLKAEFRRKVRTMARGIQTLFYKSHLMNPARYGVFAWMLISHKLVRWLVFAAMPLLPAGLAILALTQTWARVALALCALGLLLGLAGMRWPDDRKVPTLLAIPGFIVGSTVAALMAWRQALAGRGEAVWEPTRR